jgi:hypothetical protein
MDRFTVTLVGFNHVTMATKIAPAISPTQAMANFRNIAAVPRQTTHVCQSINAKARQAAPHWRKLPRINNKIGVKVPEAFSLQQNRSMGRR